MSIVWIGKYGSETQKCEQEVPQHTNTVAIPSTPRSNKEYGRELKGHTGAVECVKMETEHHRLISTGKDNTLKFWDLRSSRATHTINLMSHNLTISVHPTNSKVVVGDLENNIVEVDIDKMEVTNKFKCDALLNSVSYTPDGNHVFGTVSVKDGDMGRKFGALKVWDSNSMEEKATIQASEGSLYGMEFSKNGKYLATGGADALVGIWDFKEMICVRTLPSLSSLVRSIAFSYDSKYISMGGEGNTVFVADVETGENVHAVPVGADQYCDSMAWHNTQPVLAYATRHASPTAPSSGRGAQQSPVQLRILKVNA